MILDNDKIVFDKITEIPLTPELLEELGFRYVKSSDPFKEQTGYIHPTYHHIRLKQFDSFNQYDEQLIKMLENKKQRYCYLVAITLNCTQMTRFFNLFTYHDLRKLNKVLEKLEKLNNETRKREMKIVKPLSDIK